MPQHDPYSADASVPQEDVAGANVSEDLKDAIHEAEQHTPNGGIDEPGQTVPATPVTEEQAAKSSSGVPQGTSKEVIDWVGDDKNRAEVALAEEKASGQPRKGLVRDLEELTKK